MESDQFTGPTRSKGLTLINFVFFVADSCRYPHDDLGCSARDFKV